MQLHKVQDGVCLVQLLDESENSSVGLQARCAAAPSQLASHFLSSCDAASALQSSVSHQGQQMNLVPLLSNPELLRVLSGKPIRPSVRTYSAEEAGGSGGNAQQPQSQQPHQQLLLFLNSSIAGGAGGGSGSVVAEGAPGAVLMPQPLPGGEPLLAARLRNSGASLSVEQQQQLLLFAQQEDQQQRPQPQQPQQPQVWVLVHKDQQLQQQGQLDEGTEQAPRLPRPRQPLQEAALHRQLELELQLRLQLQHELERQQQQQQQQQQPLRLHEAPLGSQLRPKIYNGQAAMPGQQSQRPLQQDTALAEALHRSSPPTLPLGRVGLGSAHGPGLPSQQQMQEQQQMLQEQHEQQLLLQRLIAEPLHRGSLPLGKPLANYQLVEMSRGALQVQAGAELLPLGAFKSSSSLPIAPGPLRLLNESGFAEQPGSREREAYAPSPLEDLSPLSWARAEARADASWAEDGLDRRPDLAQPGRKRRPEAEMAGPSHRPSAMLARAYASSAAAAGGTPAADGHRQGRGPEVSGYRALARNGDDGGGGAANPREASGDGGDRTRNGNVTGDVSPAGLFSLQQRSMLHHVSSDSSPLVRLITSRAANTGGRAPLLNIAEVPDGNASKAAANGGVRGLLSNAAAGEQVDGLEERTGNRAGRAFDMASAAASAAAAAAGGGAGPATAAALRAAKDGWRSLLCNQTGTPALTADAIAAMVESAANDRVAWDTHNSAALQTAAILAAGSPASQSAAATASAASAGLAAPTGVSAATDYLLSPLAFRMPAAALLSRAGLPTAAGRSDIGLEFRGDAMNLLGLADVAVASAAAGLPDAAAGMVLSAGGVLEACPGAQPRQHEGCDHAERKAPLQAPDADAAAAGIPLRGGEDAAMEGVDDGEGAGERPAGGSRGRPRRKKPTVAERVAAGAAAAAAEAVAAAVAAAAANAAVAEAPTTGYTSLQVSGPAPTSGRVPPAAPKTRARGSPSPGSSPRGGILGKQESGGTAANDNERRAALSAGAVSGGSGSADGGHSAGELTALRRSSGPAAAAAAAAGAAAASDGETGEDEVGEGLQMLASRFRSRPGRVPKVLARLGPIANIAKDAASGRLKLGKDQLQQLVSTVESNLAQAEVEEKEYTRVRNRIAQRQHRNRQRERIATLEAQASEQTDVISSLRAKLQSYEAQMAQMQQLLQTAAAAASVAAQIQVQAQPSTATTSAQPHGSDAAGGPASPSRAAAAAAAAAAAVSKAWSLAGGTAAELQAAAATATAAGAAAAQPTPAGKGSTAAAAEAAAPPAATANKVGAGAGGVGAGLKQSAAVVEDP